MPISPRTLRPGGTFTPRSISGLALWLDASSSDLYTTDAGPVVAVASPLDIAGCVGWWDSSDLSAMRQNSDGTGVVAAGDPVGWWLDKSATGATVTGSGSARPTLSATGFNGRQALVFNGSSTNLSNASYTATNSLSGMTRIAVCSNTNQLAFMSRVYDGGGDTFMLMNGSWRTYAASGANFSSAAIPGSVGSSAPAGVYADVFASSAISMYALGASLPVTVVGTIAATTSAGSPALHIGSNIGVNGFWNGPIAEYIIYNRALTRAELASVESYLAQRWSISGVHAPATASSDPVGYWGDRSGNGRHVTQSVSGSRPTISATLQNGRNALAFNGSSQSLSIASYNAENGLPGLTRYIVASMSSSQPTIITRVFNGGGDSLFTTVSGELRFAAGTGAYSAVTSTNYGLLTSGTNIIGSVYDGTAGSVAAGIKPYYNGAAIPPSSTSGTLPATLPSGTPGFWIGSNIGVNSFWPGRIIEYISYSRALENSDRQRLERYLSAKYGITLAPQVSNLDAQDWINRVYQNGGTVSSATAAAVNQFCVDIENAPGGSIRDRFLRLNLFCGSFQGAFVPLYRSASFGGSPLGNDTDTNNGPFVGVGTDYAETGATGGLKGNGSTKRLDTGLAGSTLTPGDRHLAHYQSLAATKDYAPSILSGPAFGSTSSQHAIGPWTAISQHYYRTHATIGGNANVASNANGFYVGIDTSSTASRLRLNGSQIASTSGQTAANSGTTNYFIFGNGESSDARLNAYSIGLSMTDAQAEAYNTAMQAFQASLTRNV